MAMDSSKKDVIDQVVGSLPDWLGWLVIPLTFGYFLWRLWLKQEWALLGNPGNPAFPERIQSLREKTIAESYRARLERLLTPVSRLFGPEGVARAGSLEDKLFGCQPWTPLAFERLLLLAFIYPLVFLLLGWLFGEQGALGDLVVLAPAETSRKILLLALVGVAFHAGWRLNRASGWPNYILSVIVFSVAVAVAGASASAGVVAFAGLVAFAMAFEYARDRLSDNNRLPFFWIISWCILTVYIALACFLIAERGVDNRLDEGFMV